MTERAEASATFLDGVRVVELADELGEYCGRLLAGLGADVVKIEPPEGSPSRRSGPFLGGVANPERSLFFWAYNLGKRSVTLDLERAGDRERLLELLSGADVFLETTPHGQLSHLGLGNDFLRQRFPGLVVARITPFGDSGPWAGYKGSDLVHLALGGTMMLCGYDPEPGGFYDLPPIAPQLNHAYHIAGEQMALHIQAALLCRNATGRGQVLTEAVHEALAKCTEFDLLNWIYRRARHVRQTGRHAMEGLTPHTIGLTKDGRWMINFFMNHSDRAWPAFVNYLDEHGIAHDLREPPYSEIATRPQVVMEADVQTHVQEVVQRLFLRYTLERQPWHEGQHLGFFMSPLRKPHENILDPHWLKRGTFEEVEHPDLGRSFPYPVRKWVSSACDWRVGPRPPRLGEHNAELLGNPGWGARAANGVAVGSPSAPTRISKRGKPFALPNVRILDFTWLLASGGAPRFLAALGAEVIRVEWKGYMDSARTHRVGAPVGGRAARERATEPLARDHSSLNLGGQYHDVHTGRRGISLNMRHPEGLAIAKRLVAVSDIVAEGFSPGVMERWGLGFEVMRALKPDIIYVQQSGMGIRGDWGRYRANGPIAQALAGTTEMSGLPEPAPPTGFGYSYLDWMGAYSFANAMLAALHHRARTGEGMWIDAAQVECGTFLTGVPILDWAANGREWRRTGNRHPYRPAAPHGAYRCRGEDRWVAIACFTEEEWRRLTEVAGHPQWRDDPGFATLEARVANADALDKLVGAWTETRDAQEVMHALQRAGVAAGVCQIAEDTYEHDPQLAALDWLTEVTGTEIGTWPVRESPVKMSETPPYMGGALDRGGPCYGEDDDYVYGVVLGLTAREIGELREGGAI